MNPRFPLIASAATFLVAAGALGVSFKSLSQAQKLETSPTAAREYINVVEAKVAVTEIAWGIALCAERSGQLPPSSTKVPPELGRIRGRFYQSRLSDWNDVAFKCADFHLARPQRFQYQWSLIEPDKEGEVLAGADYDGDGSVDHEVRLRVRCSMQEERLRCRPNPMDTAPRPLGFTWPLRPGTDTLTAVRAVTPAAG